MDLEQIITATLFFSFIAFVLAAAVSETIQDNKKKKQTSKK
jgi:hypothetical protein